MSASERTAFINARIEGGMTLGQAMEAARLAGFRRRTDTAALLLLAVQASRRALTCPPAERDQAQLRALRACDDALAAAREAAEKGATR